MKTPAPSLSGNTSWSDYDRDYRKALEEEQFRAWREVGARGKAANVRMLTEAIPRRTVLEIGCGTGVMAGNLQASGFAERYVVTDLSRAALGEARRGCGTAIRGGVAADARAIPFRSKAFDLAILSHVLEHLEHPALAAREAARVASLLVIEVPTERVFSNFIRHTVLRLPRVPNPAGHLQFWSPRSVRRFLQEECGLSVLRSHVDLIRPEVELWGRTGRGRIKGRVKGFLKRAIPRSLYRWLLTTHVAFLCKEAD